MTTLHELARDALTSSDNELAAARAYAQLAKALDTSHTRIAAAFERATAHKEASAQVIRDHATQLVIRDVSKSEAERMLLEVNLRHSVPLRTDEVWLAVDLAYGRYDDSITADRLDTIEYGPIQYAIPGIVPYGVVLFVGAPKMGKSYMTLDWALSVVAGGCAMGSQQLSTDAGSVLMLALEDNRRRIQARIRAHMGSHPLSSEILSRLTIRTAAPRVNEEIGRDLQTLLAQHMTRHPDTRLIIVDTLARIRPNRATGNVYDDDYKALEPLIDLTHQHQVAVVIVHHTSKSDRANALDSVSGSQGLAGCVDAVIVLKRSQNSSQARLHVTGRDVVEACYECCFEQARGYMKGVARGDELSVEQRDVIRALESSRVMMNAAELAEALNKSVQSVRMMLSRMFAAELIDKPKHGWYKAKGTA